MVHIAGAITTFRGVVDAVKAYGWEVEEKVLTVKELEKRLKENPEDVATRYGLIWARNKGEERDSGGRVGGVGAKELA